MHPVLIEFGKFALYSYGTMLAIALGLCTFLTRRYAKKHGGDPDVIIDIAFWGVIGGLIGARLFFILQFYNDPAVHELLDSPFEWFAIWKGGLVFYGGLIGGTVATLLVLRLRKAAIALYIDFIAPYMALGHAIGRIGCFLNGCCWGKVCDLPWAIRFPSLVMDTPEGRLPMGNVYREHYARKLVDEHATSSLPVHPTQLYEMFGLLIIFVILLWLRKYHRRFQGEMFWAYLTLYPVERFIVELFREDPQVAFGMSAGQLVSIAIFPIGIAGWLYLRFWKYSKTSLQA